MSFISSLHPPENYNEEPFRFIFSNEKLLVCCKDGQAALPRSYSHDLSRSNQNSGQFFGLWNSVPCFIEAVDDVPPEYPEHYSFESLRSLIGVLTVEQLQIVGRAYHLYHWDRTSRFCGRCGSPMKHSDTERAKVCTGCDLIVYPRISPAVIVAVVKDDELLLAGNSRFRGKMYSVLAGFVEPGETLEECVVREIREEVGIDVTDIRYFDSQPWAFPDSLMIGFTARHAGGEIRVDGEEIMEARWFKADSLPNIPGPYSISRKLIDWFIAEHG